MVIKSVVLSVFFVFLVSVVEVETLKAGDEGACVVRISSIQMRRKSYSVVVWKQMRRKIMRRYKNESYLTWANHTICCQGYQHDGERDACAPICSTGCLGGRCTAPSTCTCEEPLYLDPQRLNACLTPVCDPPCINSICNINNICTCAPGARRYNKTHCANCDNQHEINTDLTCKPICEEPCQNGECTAPNTCTCLPGYTFEDNLCKPVCETCINSTCVAPNVCSCLEGYTPVSETACAPKCDCTNGNCIAPGQCECPDGFSLQDGVCKAECEMDCYNGYCAAPNVCKCTEGYVERFPGVCLKPCKQECGDVCDLEGECDGVCTKVEQ